MSSNTHQQPTTSSGIHTDKRFINKTILITGAGGQFGRAGALYFALRGAKVVLLDLNNDALLDTLQYVKRLVGKEQKLERERAQELREVQYRMLSEKLEENRRSRKNVDIKCSSTDALLDTMTSTMSFMGNELSDKLKRTKLAMEAGVEQSMACAADTSENFQSKFKCGPIEEDPVFWKEHPGALWNKAKEYIVALQCDVTDEYAVKECLDNAKAQFGSIDLLWNNAGYQGAIKQTLEYDPVDFGKVMQINVTGMFIVLQAAARHMATQSKSLRQKTGRNGKFSIVNTASVAGLRGTPAMVAYSSSKAAVLAMTVSTSKDLAPYGVRVNAVSPALIGPGYMWTRQNELHASSGSPYFNSDPNEVARNKVNSVPMKRLGSVDEVIQTVAFLLSEESSYTTGSNLVVDGGMSAGLKA